MSEKKQILVTGGAGYIGSHTVVELNAAGFETIIVDDFRNSQAWIIDRIEELIGKKTIHYAIDCTDKVAMQDVFEKHPNLLGVIHFAAYKAVGESVQKPLKYFRNNLGSLITVLELMAEYRVEHLVFSSSCTVYGEPQNPIVTEQNLIHKTTSPYGETKIACEQIIESTVAANDLLKATLLRYFNPIGAHESAKIGELPQGVPNNLVPYITQTAKGIRQELTVHGDDYSTPDGTNIRDYIHVVDLAKAHVKSLQWSITQESGFCEAFNLGSGKGSSVLEIIRTFEEVNSIKLNYKIGARRAGDVVQIWADPSKANSVLDWTCEYSLAEALRHSWVWEQNNK